MIGALKTSFSIRFLARPFSLNSFHTLLRIGSTRSCVSISATAILRAPCPGGIPAAGRKAHKEVVDPMKFSRTMLRRLEIKIQQAMTLDQVGKPSVTKPQAPSEAAKTGALMGKVSGQA